MTRVNGQSDDASSMPIAIVGIGLRFPGDGSDPESFWQMLLDARSARSEIPKTRYSVDGFYHPDPERLGSINTRHAHFLNQDYKVFDAPFFSITPTEAKAMDPTHRMLLEVTYEGFENAGLTLEAVRGSKTSVYVGTFTNDFQSLQIRDNAGPSMYHATGLSGSLASNRLSWFYDLKGPSMTIDTACSSSLTAFHLACQSLRTGEAEMSVVGGCNLMLGPEMTILLGAAKILSSDGKSKMWDENANGFSRGEGVGITILKPLHDALRDGNTIRAVVLASAANQDGRTSGISLPSSEAQRELICTAYRQAGVEPSDTGYVEAHGTGTQAGDPLESAAILDTIGHNRTSVLYVGSVKTNIGHLEGAAGVAGVIKAVFVVERGLIPSNLWFEKLNPRISLPENVKIPLQLCEWPSPGPRRASVNSFGFGGANAHVIVEDAAHYLERHGLTGSHSTVIKSRLPRQVNRYQANGHHRNDELAYQNGHNQQMNGRPTNGLQAKPKLFVISSSDRDGVKRNAHRLRKYLDGKGEDQYHSLLNSLAYTLGERRTAMPWKSFVIASEMDGLIKSIDDAPAAVRSSDTHAQKIALVFTGQGAQWFAMGKNLEVYEVYRHSLLRCEETLRSFSCTWSLSVELGRPENECNLHLAEFSQPACTAIQIALVDLLHHWGITPSAVVGHSSGEIAAAYCAGAISRDVAMKIAWLRGQFAGVVARKNEKGAMMAVSADAETIRPRLAQLTRGRAVIACVNSPKACTVSGDEDAVDELCRMLREDQVNFTKLKIEVAYHSPHMEIIREAYEAALSGFEVGSFLDIIPMFSSVTGSIVRPESLGPRYWVDNLTSPVKFSDAVRALIHYSPEGKNALDRMAFASVFLEVGPHSALRSYLLDIFKSEDTFKDLSYVSLLRRGRNSLQTALQAVGELYTKGCTFSLSQVNETPGNAKLLVDLPPYSWNHSVSFWQESYLGQQHRSRERPRMDLLGYPVPGSPEPQWRNFLRVSENPWIKEHCVQGNIIYPGAGLIVMAIEGARQIATSDEDILAYELRDVAISAALHVPDDDKGVEVMVQFHQRRTGTKAAPSNTLNEFTVSSWSDEHNRWQVHCRGLISITYRSQVSPPMQSELDLECQRYSDAFQDARQKCQKPVRSFLYDNVESIGMKYGPVFRNLSELYAGDHASYGVIRIPDTKSIMPEKFEYPFVIHPATLDSVLHLLFPSISGADQSLSEVVVPYAVDRLFISTEIPSAPRTELHGFSTAKKASYTTWTSSICVSTQDHHSPLIIMEGLGLASLGASEDQGFSETRAQCFEMIWHEDFELMSSDQVKKLVYRRTIPNADDDSVLDKLEYVCLVYMQRILDWFNSDGKHYIPQSGFFKLYYQWIHEMMGLFPAVDLDNAKIDTEIEVARKKISGSESGDITLQMVDRIGQNLSKIFSKQIEPLQVMLEGDLLYKFYRGAFGTSFNSNVAEYVGMIADKKPGLSILEIGAGTGGTTYHVLERLRNEDGTSKAKRYFFTDISPGFLANAVDRFSKDASIMEFGTLNIEDNPTDQGFQPESFDLIVCANVLHATKSISETLANCYSVLKPGGKLILSEVTIKRIFCGFIMGTLPGWWLGEDDGRKGGPLLDVTEWDAALKQANFSGVDIDIRGDSNISKEPVSLLVSTKSNNSRPQNAKEFALIGTAGVLTTALCSEIRKNFESHGFKPSLLEWGAFAASEIAGKYCICLAEWEDPILAQISGEEWASLRNLVLTAKGTLWITGGAAMDCSRPFGSLMIGLSRAIRNENANVSIATLDTDQPDCLVMDISSAAIYKVAISHSCGDSADHEYALRDGMIYVPRVTKAPSLNKRLLEYESKGEPEEVSFTGCGRPLKLTIKTPGLLDTFRFEEDETYYEPMPEDWVEIEVKAVGLNFKDVLVAMGKLNEDKLGVDVSGVVTRVGTDVTGIKLGDRLMTSSCNTFATFVRFPALGAIHMPDSMSFVDAASMPLIYLTAYYALITIGRLARGETVLIHAAAGGVGQAAIVIAQHVGAKIFGTVGSEEKKQLIMKEYGIPENRIFSSRDLSFAKAVMRATNNVGVDVLLNSLAGEALRLSWHCLAKFGRFLEIGKADLFANTGLDMAPFLDNKTYAGVNLIDFENNPTPRAVALYREVAQLIKNNTFQPVKPIMLFQFGEIEKAFRYMQTGKHSGKIVIRVDEKDFVPAVPRAPRIEIQSDATYVLAGGLGGICREIGRWLAERGARTLIFLSRSAASGKENIDYVQSLKDTYGTNAIAFNCDVADKNSLQTVLDKCKNLSPIRGVITGAMVLRDKLFEAMTVEDFRTTIGPKVHGTWNLHDMLPKDLDFFVMLSSLAGVMGHRGQGNYGAGNVFQDYFASYRRSQGLRAMTIDIGYLLSVGFVAEHDEYVDHVKSMGLKVMNDNDLHGFMAIAMKCTEAHPAQIMVGLPTNEYKDSWYWIQDGKFASLLNLTHRHQSSTETTVSLSDQLMKVTDLMAAIDLICGAMVDKLAKLMMVPASDIDPVKPLSTYGVDSLVAVEVRNWMAKEILVEVSVFEIMANVPMRQLAVDLAGKSRSLERFRADGT